MSARLVHRSLVAALRCWIAEVVPQSTSHVASLVGGLASDYVQDERVTRNLLILLHLDDVAGLDASPVQQLEVFASLIKDKLLNRLLVDSIRSSFQSLVMQEVDDAPRDQAHHCH